MPNILVGVDRHLVLGRYLYGRADWFEVVCDDPCLLEIARELKLRCHRRLRKSYEYEPPVVWKHYTGLPDKYRDNFSAKVLTWGLSIMLR